jgi:hypothetical protein
MSRRDGWLARARFRETVGPVMAAKCLIVHVQAGVQRLWCDVCRLDSARRVYALTDRTVGVVGVACPLCRSTRKP